MNIYEIDARIEEIFVRDVDENGEITEEALAELEQLQMDRDAKIEGAACLRKNAAAEAAAIKAEIQALQERLSGLTKKTASLDRYLTQALAGATFETPRVQIKWRKSTTVEIEDAAAWCDKHMLDPELVSITVSRSPNKTALRKLLQTKEIPGATLAEHYNIQIK